MGKCVCDRVRVNSSARADLDAPYVLSLSSCLFLWSLNLTWGQASLTPHHQNSLSFISHEGTLSSTFSFFFFYPRSLFVHSQGSVERQSSHCTWIIFLPIYSTYSHIPQRMWANVYWCVWCVFVCSHRVLVNVYCKAYIYIGDLWAIAAILLFQVGFFSPEAAFILYTGALSWSVRLHVRMRLSRSFSINNRSN